MTSAAFNETTNAERSENLRLIEDSVAAFAARKFPPVRARRLRGTVPEFDAGLFAEIAGQGWIGIVVPEAIGGSGLGFTEARPMVEILARHLVSEPVVPVAIACTGMLTRCDPAARRDEMLASIIDGRSVPALAWQDGKGELPDRSLPFEAARDGAAWIVDGEARFLRPGSGATSFLLLARAEGRPVLFACAPSQPGVEIGREAQADGTTLARLRAQRLRLPDDAAMFLSPEAIEDTLHETLVMNAVELLGVMTTMRQMTLEYLKTRVQFGRPIGSFQALQHRAVDMLIQEELARAVIDDAIAALDHRAPRVERAKLASRAKARAAGAALAIAREAIQMHGGIGVTDEYDLSLYVNRTLALAPWLGNAAQHRHRYGHLDAAAATSQQEGRP